MTDKNKLTQIYKAQARKFFNDGHTIYLLPCKCGLGGVWVSPCPINKTDWDNFNSAVNGYEYYNCISELGLYAHYYIELK